MAIERSEVPSVLLAACPSFERAWRAHAEEHGEDLLYVAAGSFAHHLLDLYRTGQTTALASVAAAIERLLLDGTPWVKEFATIGILEGVQNVWGNSGADSKAFYESLGEEGQRWWRGLDHFWSGEQPMMARDD